MNIKSNDEVLKFLKNVQIIDLYDIVLDDILEFLIELISEHGLVSRDILTQI